jgi:hypothetical protein
MEVSVPAGQVTAGTRMEAHFLASAVNDETFSAKKDKKE